MVRECGCCVDCVDMMYVRDSSGCLVPWAFCNCVRLSFFHAVLSPFQSAVTILGQLSEDVIIADPLWGWSWVQLHVTPRAPNTIELDHLSST